MPSKRKSLPKNFDRLLLENNIEELKAIFQKCEINAVGGYGKQTALAFDECSHEFACWLCENGADLQAKDTWGNTPLHIRSRSKNGNIKSLLDLGADVNDSSSTFGTPLHTAADSHNVENTSILLENNAKTDIKNSNGLFPLEQGLQTCRNIDIVDTLKISELFFDKGVKITSKMKEFVIEIGESFEFHRENFNKENVEEVSTALEKLYNLFEVKPVAERKLHDGKSMIVAKSQKWQDQHQELWELLVPSSGFSKTVQGEVIRISGKIGNEIEGNGGINWDSEFKKMADAFLNYVKQGNSLQKEELKETKNNIKVIKKKSGDTERIAELAVKWVNLNPKPIELKIGIE